MGKRRQTVETIGILCIFAIFVGVVIFFLSAGENLAEWQKIENTILFAVLAVFFGTLGILVFSAVVAPATRQDKELKKYFRSKNLQITWARDGMSGEIHDPRHKEEFRDTTKFHPMDGVSREMKMAISAFVVCTALCVFGMWLISLL